ncbi:unnamed protein product [Protopolystoma xenopodis]|uniref:Uncharacterized protein n=1 Tax=Protopolystoma xenopodis TaxID=117903 RepID=A0A448XSF0_9PLAT|nr:unnamed protein product [Protopolystoma xenopodis]
MLPHNAASAQAHTFVHHCFIGLAWSHAILAAWTRFWPIQLACLMLAFAGLSRASRCLGLPSAFAWLFRRTLAWASSLPSSSGFSLTHLSSKSALTSVISSSVSNTTTMGVSSDMSCRSYHPPSFIEETTSGNSSSFGILPVVGGEDAEDGNNDEGAETNVSPRSTDLPSAVPLLCILIPTPSTELVATPINF